MGALVFALFFLPTLFIGRGIVEFMFYLEEKRLEK